MNPLGIVLAIGTVGVLWFLTQSKPRFFVDGETQGQTRGVSFWPNLAVGPAKTKLDQLVATPHPDLERVWIVSPLTATNVPTALTTALLIQSRGNLVLAPKELLELSGAQTTLIAEALPGEVADRAPLNQDLIGVLPV